MADSLIAEIEKEYCDHRHYLIPYNLRMLARTATAASQFAQRISTVGVRPSLVLSSTNNFGRWASLSQLKLRSLSGYSDSITVRIFMSGWHLVTPVFQNSTEKEDVLTHWTICYCSTRYNSTLAGKLVKDKGVSMDPAEHVCPPQKLSTNQRW